MSDTSAVEQPGEPQENAEHGQNTEDEMSDPATEGDGQDDAVDQ